MHIVYTKLNMCYKQCDNSSTNTFTVKGVVHYTLHKPTSVVKRECCRGFLKLFDLYMGVDFNNLVEGSRCRRIFKATCKPTYFLNMYIRKVSVVFKRCNMANWNQVFRVLL